ncbi:MULTISPECIES: hypothetical protein [unclassified Pseudomonas]|uniref:hypothetical protein n=1 Tax=Pseudomonas TaxID=286 RepID=UPI0024B38C8B|nr:MULTISPECIES: hypothetical protein [unclassified Pseudomonas]
MTANTDSGTTGEYKVDLKGMFQFNATQCELRLYRPPFFESHLSGGDDAGNASFVDFFYIREIQKGKEYKLYPDRNDDLPSDSAVSFYFRTADGVQWHPVSGGTVRVSNIDAVKNEIEVVFKCTVESDRGEPKRVDVTGSANLSGLSKLSVLDEVETQFKLRSKK